MSNICATVSNSALVPTTGNLDGILREQGLSFCTLYRHKGPGRVSDHKCEPIYTQYQAIQLLDREGSSMSPSPLAQFASAVVNPAIESGLYFCKYFQRTSAQEASREYSRRAIHV